MTSQQRAAIIKQTLDASGKSVRWLAREIGVGNQVASNWLNGVNSPRDEAAWRKMEIAVGNLSPAGSPDNQGDDQTPITLSDGRRVRFSRMIKVPIIGVVSAGPGVDELIEGDEIWVPNSMVVGIEEPFAQLVEGDSMLPWLRPGDVVVAKPLRQERLGYAFIVRSADGQVRVKQLIYDQNEWRFRSINRDKYPDEPARDQLVGLVVGRYRFEDGEETTVFNPRGLKPRRDLFE